MSIAKIPVKRVIKKADFTEEAAKEFIKNKKSSPQPEWLKNIRTRTKKQVLINLDIGLLKKVDMLAKKSGVSRAALVNYLLNKTIDDEKI